LAAGVADHKWSLLEIAALLDSNSPTTSLAADVTYCRRNKTTA
jgi:hypothetical protein